MEIYVTIESNDMYMWCVGMYVNSYIRYLAYTSNGPRWSRLFPPRPTKIRVHQTTGENEER
jgi:hypothetical protein